MKLFFALDINNKEKSALNNWRNDIVVPLISHENVKLIPQDNFHITLCFIGDVSLVQRDILIKEAQQLTKQVAKPRDDIENKLFLKAIGLFKQPKVLYLAPCSDKNKPLLKWLTSLANHLSNTATNLGLHQENRPYLPHLSLFRKATFIPEPIPDANIELALKSFSLYQSISTDSGVRYQAINTWSLT
jgi:2'-5' RNA ligase